MLRPLRPRPRREPECTIFTFFTFIFFLEQAVELLLMFHNVNSIWLDEAPFAVVAEFK